MAPSRAAVRPLASWKRAFRQCRAQKIQRRFEHTFIDIVATSKAAPLPAAIEGPPTKKVHKLIPSFPPIASTWQNCKDPVAAVSSSQIAALDPTGVRTRLFSKQNPEAARVGDVLLVRLKNGEPYSGVCMNIRRRGVDTGILLRNQLTRVGVEMWFKIYSPNVTGIEVVQRKAKRARRARLYYMRKPKHDMGSVEGIVRQYLRQRAMLGSSQARGRDANSHKKNKKRGRN